MTLCFTYSGATAGTPLGESRNVRPLYKTFSPLLQVLGRDEPDGVALLVSRLPPAGVGGVDDLEDITVLERKTNFSAGQQGVFHWIITEEAADVILERKTKLFPQHHNLTVVTLLGIGLTRLSSMLEGWL